MTDQAEVPPPPDTVPPPKLDLEEVMRVLLARADQTDHANAVGHAALIRHIDGVNETLSARIDALAKRLEVLEQDKDKRFDEVIGDLAKLKHLVQTISDGHMDLQRRVTGLEAAFAKGTSATELTVAVRELTEAIRLGASR